MPAMYRRMDAQDRTWIRAYIQQLLNRNTSLSKHDSGLVTSLQETLSRIQETEHHMAAVEADYQQRWIPLYGKPDHTASLTKLQQWDAKLRDQLHLLLLSVLSLEVIRDSTLDHA
jgi:hypothetical protein